jgi:hypothetical protein
LIDFFTNQRVSIDAQIKVKKESIEKFSNLIEPTFLITQSTVLAMNQAYNEIEINILTKLDKQNQLLNEKFENIIINYVRIVQLGIEIYKNKASNEFNTNKKFFEENLFRTKEAQPNLIVSIIDTLLMDINIDIDDAYSLFNENYRNILKILDTFQLKITQYHSILSEFPSISSELSKISSIAQDLEEELTEFKRHLHLNIESFIYKYIKQLEPILSQILDNIKQEEGLKENLVEKFENIYFEIKNILNELLNQLKTFVSEYFNEKSGPLDKIIRDLMDCIENNFDSIRSIKFSNDQQLQTELQQLDAKIIEYQTKMRKMISPL